MSEKLHQNFSSFIKENTHCFVIGNIFLFFSLYLLGFLVDSDLTEQKQIILVQIMIILTGFLFLSSVSMLFTESIRLRKDEMVFWNIWKFKIYSEDIGRLIFFVPLFLVAVLYWGFIITFLPIHPMIFSALFLGFTVILTILIEIQMRKEKKWGVKDG